MPTGVFTDVRLDITPVTPFLFVLALANSVARSHVASRRLIEMMLDSDNTSRTMIFSAGDLIRAEEACSVVEPRSEEAALSCAQTSAASACTEVE